LIKGVSYKSITDLNNGERNINALVFR
jgi:hypothetical protein